MLDFVTYRTSEMLAKSRISSWRVAQPHNLDHFQTVGFPVRVNSFGELGQLVDTMQENRFASYIQELGGFTDSERDLFVDVCCDAVHFQIGHFQQKPPVIPLSTLISVFVLYMKMRNLDPDFETVLEIGPGCGYLSFFLKHHRTLKRYVQVEAAESFYIYQHMINLHCFGSRFYDHAYPPREAKLEQTSSNSGRREVGFEDVVEHIPILEDVRIEPVCEKYPWWRLGELAGVVDNFDFVTSNATLREFSIEALTQYLAIISNSLKPDGLFIAQCTGHPANGNLEQLFERLKARSFAPLLFVDTSSPVKCDSDIRSGLISRITGSLGNAPEARMFARQNLAYVKKGHPLFDKYISTPNVCKGEQCDGFVAPEPLVKKMFFDRPNGRKKYSAAELVSLTKQRLSYTGGKLLASRQ